MRRESSCLLAHEVDPRPLSSGLGSREHGTAHTTYITLPTKHGGGKLGWFMISLHPVDTHDGASHIPPTYLGTV
jgi:hypothetical protein